MNIHCGPSATGNSSGSDWSNQAVLPNTTGFTRGDIYYLADGSYGSRTFSEAVSGTTLITIKKATVADHGVATGWVDTMGDGQADFSSTLVFNTGYWVLDGQTRNESNWFDGTAYGFKVNHNNQDAQVEITDPAQTTAINSIQLRNIYIAAIVGNVPDVTIRRYAIDTDQYGGPLGTGHVFHKVYIEGSNNPFFVRGSLAPLIEYCATDSPTGNAANHAGVVNLYYNPANTIVRYCHFKNSFTGAGGESAGGGTGVIIFTFTNGHEIYGNLIDNFQVGDAACGFVGGDSSNIKVYNNTFVKSTEGGGGIAANAGSGNVVRNNLFVGVNSPDISVGSGSTITHNAYSSGSGSGSSTQVNVPTSIFVDYAGGNYRLASATTAGVTLASPYNTDLLGTTRGADGTWDRGAFEFGVGGGGGPLTFAVLTQPTKGTLSGTAPNLTYTPTLNQTGADSFTFKVTSSAVDSTTKTVSITITPVADPPTANPKTVVLLEDVVTPVVLTGSA